MIQVGNPQELTGDLDRLVAVKRTKTASWGFGGGGRVGAHTGFQQLGQDSGTVNGAGKASGLSHICPSERHEVPHR